MCDRTFQRTRDVEIAEHVARKIERRLERTRFESVDEYAAVALELLVREVTDGDEPAGADAERDPRDVDVEDAEALQEQLESLGYL